MLSSAGSFEHFQKIHPNDPHRMAIGLRQASDMSSTPLWLKWHKTLQWFSRAMVTCETVLLRRDENQLPQVVGIVSRQGTSLTHCRYLRTMAAPNDVPCPYPLPLPPAPTCLSLFEREASDCLWAGITALSPPKYLASPFK